MDWISVKDRLPVNGQMISACNDTRQIGCICRYFEYEEEKLPCLIYGPLKCLGFTWKDVTHWMPLPEPPKDEFPILLERKWVDKEEMIKYFPEKPCS